MRDEKLFHMKTFLLSEGLVWTGVETKTNGSFMLQERYWQSLLSGTLRSFHPYFSTFSVSFRIQTNVAVPPVVMGGQCSQQLRRDSTTEREEDVLHGGEKF